jgi:predicted dehydrogenase
VSSAAAEASDPAARRLTWGILGTAQIARVCVIPAILHSRNGTAHALASRSLPRAQALAQEHAIPTTYGEYQQLIDDPRVDAVYIPLPNHLHREWTLRALRAGKHVLCEKPLALNAAEAQEMATVATETGQILMEAFMYRFHPRSRRVKELVDSGAIGDPRLVRAAFCFDHQDPTDIRFKPEMGGGALMDVGCYGVSLARWMLGLEPESVQASAEYSPSGVDVQMIGLLRFPGGRLASVEASFTTALQQTYTIVGTQGAIELPHDAYIPWGKDATFRLRATRDEEGQVETVPGADEYQLMVEHFADAALGRAPLEFPPEESVANMRVLDALAQAAREGEARSVTVPRE